jgi:hypothetical protein
VHLEARLPGIVDVALVDLDLEGIHGARRPRGGSQPDSGDPAILAAQDVITAGILPTSVPLRKRGRLAE